MVHRGGMLLVVLLLLASACPAQAESTPNEVFAFAEFLSKESERYRAITEYKRFVFLFPKEPRADEATVRICELYLSGEEFVQAARAARATAARLPVQHPLQARIAFVKGNALIGLGDEEAGRSELLTLAAQHHASPLVGKALMIAGRSYARTGRYQDAAAVFSQIEALGGPYRTQGADARQIISDMAQVPMKSPTVAGTLGALLPGSGHLYVGRKSSALYAFLLTAAFTAAAVESFENRNDALGAGLTVIAVLAYGSNIFSAVNTAHNYNRQQNAYMLRKLEHATPMELESKTGAFPFSLSFRWRF